MKAYSLFALFFAGLSVMSGCAVENDIDWGLKTTGLVVDIRSVDGAALPAPGELIPVPASGSTNGVDIVLDVAVLAAGESAVPPGSDLWVRISTRPGKLQVLDAGRFVGNDVLLSGGVGTGIKVRVWDVFGPVRIWVEDAGFKPRTTIGSISQCDDGVDNDGDGRADYPQDSGCLAATDDSEEPGTGAAGVSTVIEFDTPTAAQLQGYFAGVNDGFEGTTPYAGEGVTVDKGTLIVTRVTTDGMYVTDTSATGDGYNHLFVFTYNTPTTRPICETDEYDSASCINQDDKPVAMRVCDRLVSVGGAVSEFYGFTEVSFPVWDTVLWNPDDAPCPVPEPVELQAANFRGSGAVPMEAFEAGLVVMNDVDAATADDVVNCDYNGDGAVDFRDYDTNYCSSECECREACNDDNLCVEITQYNEYGQWPARLGGPSGVKVWINSRESVPEFDPWAADAPSHYSAIVGTLRNLSFLDPHPWIVEPRCGDDLVVTGERLPSSQACVNPRTGD